LRRWVERKYKIPWNHDCIQSQTEFELLTSFFEEYYEKNKIEAHTDEKGNVLYATGDPLVDKWEKEISQGLNPDLQEGLAKTKEPSKDVKGFLKDIKDLENINDDYSNLSQAGNRLGSAYADR